jgi:TM2 domain-containing membrane protein YozV
MEYYIAEGSQIRGPMPVDQLPAHGLSAHSLVWRPGLDQWIRAGLLQEPDVYYRAAPVPPPLPLAYAMADNSALDFDRPYMHSKRIAAGICGIVLGTLGIHKIIIDRPGHAAAIILGGVVSFGMCLPFFSLIGLIEGIIYLTLSDEDFYQRYYVERKCWF